MEAAASMSTSPSSPSSSSASRRLLLVPDGAEGPPTRPSWNQAVNTRRRAWMAADATSMSRGACGTAAVRRATSANARGRSAGKFELGCGIGGAAGGFRVGGRRNCVSVTRTHLRETETALGGGAQCWPRPWTRTAPQTPSWLNARWVASEGEGTAQNTRTGAKLSSPRFGCALAPDLLIPKISPTRLRICSRRVPAR